MRRRPARPPLKGGFDPIGPFHPYLVYAGVILLNLIGLILILLLLTWIGDTVEDWLWPGGSEWVDF